MAKKFSEKSANELRTYEFDGDNFSVTREIDVTDVLAQNEQDRNYYRPGQMIGNTQRHFQKVASIPAEIYFRWTHMFGTPQENPTRWKKLLNDPDNKYMRTSEGRL